MKGFTPSIWYKDRLWQSGLGWPDKQAAGNVELWSPWWDGGTGVSMSVPSHVTQGHLLPSAVSIVSPVIINMLLQLPPSPPILSIAQINKNEIFNKNLQIVWHFVPISQLYEKFCSVWKVWWEWEMICAELRWTCALTFRPESIL